MTLSKDGPVMTASATATSRLHTDDMTIGYGNRTHAAPRPGRGLPAQAGLRDTLTKGAGHRFARLRRALAAS